MVVGSGVIAFRQLYDKTVYTWEHGPGFVSFVWAHVLPLALIVYLLPLSLHLWLLIAIPITLIRWRDPSGLRTNIIVCCGLLVLAAIYTPSSRCLNLLFEAWGPGPHGASNLFYAAAEGELYNVRTLVNHGVAVDATNEYGRIALMAASVTGRLDVVKYLR